jgi:polysaccharide pyruvyl transferase WcaK-like protein
MPILVDLWGRRVMRIVVDQSGYPLLNLGDIAMLQACIRRLWDLWPGAEIQVFTESPERLAQYCPGTSPVALTVMGRRGTSVVPVSAQRSAEQMLKIAMPLLDRSKPGSIRRGPIPQRCGVLDTVRHADLVISSGGGFVNDVFWMHGSHVLSVLAMAQRLGKPTAMFGQGIGPLTKPLLTRLVKRTMPQLTVIGLREGLGSLPLLASVGFEDGRADVTGDDALLLATPPQRPTTGTAIGLNVRVSFYSGIDRKDARQAVDVSSEWARSHGATATAMPVSLYKGESDLDAIQTSTKGSHSDAAQQHFTGLETPGELADRAANCRVVVTGSYHAAVFALAAGVPAVCLTNSRYYDLKFEGLGAQFPEGCQIVRPGPSFKSELRGAIDRAWEMEEAERDSLHAAALAQVEKADRLYARFKSMVNSTANQPTT